MKVGVCIPCSYESVLKDFMWQLTKWKGKYKTYISNHPMLTRNRNQLVKKAMNDGCTHLLFLDADIIMPDDGIDILLSHDKDAVGLLCFMKKKPYNPVIYNNGKILDPYPKGLVNVDATGTGCLMVKSEVFRKIETTPQFKQLRGAYFAYQEDYINDLVLGEDLTFCALVKHAGYDIYVDTNNTCLHYTTIGIGERHYKLNRETGFVY